MIPAYFRLKEEKGSVGMLSIVTMVLLGVVGTAYILLSSSEFSSAASYRNGVAAQFLAEAGARRAIVELDKDNSWMGVSNERLGNGITEGSYKVEVTSTGPNCTIASTGMVGNATRKMVLRLTLFSSVFSYPLFSHSNMNIGNSDVYGSVRSNGTINLNNGAHITKDVIAQGDVTGKQNATVGGQILAHQTALPVPVYNKADFSSATVISSVDNHETLTLAEDRYYSNGEFKINGNLVGNATIYVAGNVLIENGAEISGSIRMIAEGDINSKQGAKVDSGIFFSKQNINFEENSIFTGSAAASGTINISNNATITWNKDVVTYFGLGDSSAPLIINSWGNQ